MAWCNVWQEGRFRTAQVKSLRLYAVAGRTEVRKLNRTGGWTRTALKAGDNIAIVGPQNKNGSGDLNLSHESKITMTDAGKVIHNSIKVEQAPPAPPAN